MDFGSMLDDSFAYAKDGVWKRWTRWLVLILSIIIFPLILGYIVRIYRGERSAPEPGQWGSMFVDGLKLLVVQIIYWAPVILLVILAFIPLVSALVTSGMFSQDFSSMSETQAERWLDSHPELIKDLLVAGGFMALAIHSCCNSGHHNNIFFIPWGGPFCPDNRSISEAFNFSEILSHIRRIGWINYIIALVAITIIGFIFGMVLNFFSLIPHIGPIIGLILKVILYVPFLLFSARFSALVSNAGEEGNGGLANPDTV